MDDIDKAKVGKKDEKLVGWDHIRHQQGIGTNYPPMRAKDVDGPNVGLPYTYTPPKREPFFKTVFKTALEILYLAIAVVILIIAIIVAMKIFGY